MNWERLHAVRDMTADGMVAWQISVALGVSHSTVHRYRRLAREVWGA